MSKNHVSETPFVDAGPAVGKDSPELKNDVLSKGEGHLCDSDCTPGTADHAEPRHAEGGPGHAECEHE